MGKFDSLKDSTARLGLIADHVGCFSGGKKGEEKRTGLPEAHHLAKISSLMPTDETR